MELKLTQRANGELDGALRSACIRQALPPPGSHQRNPCSTRDTLLI